MPSGDDRSGNFDIETFVFDLTVRQFRQLGEERTAGLGFRIRGQLVEIGFALPHGGDAVHRRIGLGAHQAEADQTGHDLPPAFCRHPAASAPPATRAQPLHCLL
jgi:hypothetical protein